MDLNRLLLKECFGKEKVLERLRMYLDIMESAVDTYGADHVKYIKQEIEEIEKLDDDDNFLSNRSKIIENIELQKRQKLGDDNGTNEGVIN